jgi:hypothetical protein
MNDGDPPAADGPPDAELHELARDWITLWQSELAALAVDREAQEGFHTLLALWAGAAASMLRAVPHDRSRPGAAVAPRPTPAAAAPGARDAEIERLGRHIAELERRLAELERGGGRAGAGDRRGAGRARRKIPPRGAAGGDAAGS